jgi:hypothetical protein
MEPTMAFAVRDHAAPAIEVRVNFGVFAGREATAAEIERLAAWLLDEVGEVSIIAEARHEIDSSVEASKWRLTVSRARGRPATSSSARSSSGPSTGRTSVSPSATSMST